MKLIRSAGLDRRLQAGLRDAECDGTVDDAIDTANKEIGVRNECVMQSDAHCVLLTRVSGSLESLLDLTMSTSVSCRRESRRSVARSVSGGWTLKNLISSRRPYVNCGFVRYGWHVLTA